MQLIKYKLHNIFLDFMEPERTGKKYRKEEEFTSA
jgi:hypothetical protein